MTSLPASILEKSRMSLMTVSKASPDAADHLGVFALLGSEAGVEQQTGHADDAVHGGADFVAHVGQKLALGHGWRLPRPPRRAAAPALPCAAPPCAPPRVRQAASHAGAIRAPANNAPPRRPRPQPRRTAGRTRWSGKTAATIQRQRGLSTRSRCHRHWTRPRGSGKSREADWCSTPRAARRRPPIRGQTLPAGNGIVYAPERGNSEPCSETQACSPLEPGCRFQRSGILSADTRSTSTGGGRKLLLILDGSTVTTPP